MLYRECCELHLGCGLAVKLDRAADCSRRFEIGTIGTGRSEGVVVASPLHERFAEALATVHRSILLIDTRRNGCGGQGSWGPLELATLVPEYWPQVRQDQSHEYAYLHVPLLAPSVALRSRGRQADGQHWEVFRERYLREISQSTAVLVGRALVEHAAAHDALPVFLCAEPLTPDFDQRDREKQNRTYCHRFTLAKAICRALHTARGDVEVNRIDLSIGGTPRVTLLQAHEAQGPPDDRPTPIAEARETAGPRSAVQTDDDPLVGLGFQRHQLDDTHFFYTGSLPQSLWLDDRFGELWDLHPNTFHRIRMGGREVETPRWQQAFGRDYEYTGQVNQALAIPDILMPLLQWCRDTFDHHLNGILVNWYDGSLGHYIGKHRDSIKNLIPGSPIVTISFGVERTFRLRPYRRPGNRRDFVASNGAVFMMPFDTNQCWTHEVPRKRDSGRRISVTFRAFS